MLKKYSHKDAKAPRENAMHFLFFVPSCLGGWLPDPSEAEIKSVYAFYREI
jgi:hypothetical protein